MDNTAKEILTASEVAEYMQLSTGYILQLCRTGQIPAIKLGNRYRIPKISLVRWLEKESMKETTNVVDMDWNKYGNAD